MRHLLLLALLVPTLACPNRRPPNDDDTPDDDDDANANDDDSAPNDDDTGDDDDTSDDDDTGDDDDSTPPLTGCDAALTGPSNVGCVFWAADLDNAENFIDAAAAGQFAVAVANTDPSITAHVEVTINEADPGLPPLITLVEEQDITPGGLYIFLLPRRDVDGIPTVLHTDAGTQTWHSSRAFRIEADAPVVAYQFNTLDQQFSNDASLLFPQTSLGHDHLVIGWPSSGPIAPPLGPGTRGYVTILGTEEETVVTVTPTADIVHGTGVPETSPGSGIGILAGTSATFTIAPYDVLNLETTFIDVFQFPPPAIPDLSGTTVASDKRVAVFFGTDLSVVTDGIDDGSDGCCAEHLEQQVIPNRAMRNNFVVSHSAVRVPADPEYDVYRIIALFNSTTVDTNLPGGDASFTLQAGEWHELKTRTGFIVEATGPVHVAQFQVQGSDAGYIGDSSLVYVPPVEQRRDRYIFTTGQGFSSNFAVVSLPQGMDAELDGVSILSGSCTGPAIDGVFDGTTYVTYTCAITEDAHELIADGDAGLYVYGYYNAGSYAYPAGAGLE